MNPLSFATTYIETFLLRADNGEPQPRSYATGFFVRGPDDLFLVTNWHVFSGLDPANPTSVNGAPPHYVKLSVISKSGGLNELTFPLYDEQMNPLWEEHSQRFAVDVAVFPLPLSLAQHFHMVDIRTAAHDEDIEEGVAKDVFVLGYPFSREDMKKNFGNDAPYYLPVWKRGTIASEPRVRLGNKVILIDALSRRGMSGAPVLISEDREFTRMEGVNSDVWRRFEQGSVSAVNAICSLDTTRMPVGTEKRFKLLGIYSGVIGSTKLAEVALGKCWHADVLQELIESPVPGEMPFHAHLPNDHYGRFFSQFGKGQLIRRNVRGESIETISLG